MGRRTVANGLFLGAQKKLQTMEIWSARHVVNAWRRLESS